MAEGEGFEPPELSLSGFQDRRLKPLGHPSATEPGYSPRPAIIRVSARHGFSSGGLIARFDDLDAAHVAAQGFGDDHGSVFLLKVLENGDKGAPDGEP